MIRDDVPLDRSGFFRSLLRSVGRFINDLFGEQLEETAARLEEHFPALIRPPGAVHEESFLHLCRRCGACVRACPHFSVRVYFRSPSFFERTPYLDPRDSYCRFCENFPCIRACPSGALRLPTSGLPRIGTAQVMADRCVNVTGAPAIECHACIDHCPSRFSAIRWSDAPPRVPYVISQACTGCGACVSACPARPDPAIVLTPKE